jgi:hypothetical protein
VFDSFTEAQWVGFSFVLLGMALICAIASAAATIGLIIWGVVRNRRPT